MLARYLHLEAIPALAKDWDVDVRGAVKLATTLAEHPADAALFKLLATLRDDADVGTVDDWRWTGPAARLRHLVRTARRAPHGGPGRAARRVEELNRT